MKRVVGLGGVFFKAEDRDRLMGWYRDHLGIDSDKGELWEPIDPEADPYLPPD